MRVFIDTQLWVYAQKQPTPDSFETDSKYQEALDKHEKALAFLQQAISEDEIAMTYHQICEIFHALAFRGNRNTPEYALQFCRVLIQAKYITWHSVAPSDVERALELSQASGIPVWDFLCVLPLISDVDVLYSCDEHFQNPTIHGLGPRVENPIGVWQVL
jgi:predicted nucleic acid-binding protein